MQQKSQLSPGIARVLSMGLYAFAGVGASHVSQMLYGGSLNIF